MIYNNKIIGRINSSQWTNCLNTKQIETNEPFMHRIFLIKSYMHVLVQYNAHCTCTDHTNHHYTEFVIMLILMLMLMNW